MSNSKKGNTSLTLAEEELLAVAVQKYPCLYDKSHRSHKKKCSSKCFRGCYRLVRLC